MKWKFLSSYSYTYLKAEGTTNSAMLFSGKLKVDILYHYYYNTAY